MSYAVILDLTTCLQRLVRSLRLDSRQSGLDEFHHSLDTSDDSLAYRYDRVPCDGRDRRVVEGDFKRDGRLHIHLIIDPVGGLPTGQYCTIFKFADGETEQSALPVNVMSRTARISIPVVFLRQRWIVRCLSMMDSSCKSQVNDSLPPLRTLNGGTFSIASRVFGGIPPIL